MSDRAVILTRALLAFAFMVPSVFLGWGYALGALAGVILGVFFATRPENERGGLLP